MTRLTRQGFRTSAAQVRAYELDGPGRAPAFLAPLDLLPREQAPALAELPARRSAPARPWPTIAVAQARMAQGEQSAVELLREALERIQRRDGELNAFVAVAPEAELLELAGRLDAERRRGQLRGPLHGIPISVKDVIAVAGMPNTASSAVLAGAVAAERSHPGGSAGRRAARGGAVPGRAAAGPGRRPRGGARGPRVAAYGARRRFRRPSAVIRSTRPSGTRRRGAAGAAWAGPAWAACRRSG